MRTATRFRPGIILTVVFFAAAVLAFSQEPAPFSIDTSPLPAPTGFVNDYAGVIDEGLKQQLENRLKQFRDKSNTELAVAVVRTTGERPIFDYSLAVARGWKIGSKEDDNPSALLLVAIDDRKYFTQVSRDLEDELPDGLVGSLQRHYLVPEFRKGNYGKGIADTIEAYIRTIETRRSGSGDTPQTGQTERRRRETPTLYGVFCCLVIVFVIAIIVYNMFSKRSHRDRDRWGGGGFGGGAAGALPWIIGSVLTSGGSSGSSSSSDWGGNSGDWGGFGGGGDFGGGGAGGDW